MATKNSSSGIGPVIVVVLVLAAMIVSGVMYFTASCGTLGHFMRAYELPARCNATPPAVVVDPRR